MSFIMVCIKCQDCGKEMNVALGTFGYGMPEKCPKCKGENFVKISNEWKWEKPESEISEKIIKHFPNMGKL